jgi:uncharacterized SAM-binding protein YcdF (DUF218 family)
MSTDRSFVRPRRHVKGEAGDARRSAEWRYHPPVPSVLVDLVKYSFVPGSMSFLVAGLVVGTLLLYPERLRRVGRAWLTLLAAGYVALAMPATVVLLERGLGPSPRRIETRADADGATAIVVLGAGAVTWGEGDLAVHQLSRRSAINAIEGARLHRLLGGVPVIASGGIVSGALLERAEADIMADTLVGLGVPRDRILVDPVSQNTYEQSVRVARLVAGHPRFVLVTTPVHLRRAMALFEARGLHPVAGPSDVGGLHEGSVGRLLAMPSLASLRMSELAIYEYLATGHARLRGWLAANDGIR